MSSSSSSSVSSPRPSAAVAVAAAAAAAKSPSLLLDTRNLHWKQNNVGSRLLQKMGWSDGQAVGKRQRSQRSSTSPPFFSSSSSSHYYSSSSSTSNNNKSNNNDATEHQNHRHKPLHFSSEGLRIVKRREGLGLGASHQPYTVDSSYAVQNLSNILQQLQKEYHPSISDQQQQHDSNEEEEDSDTGKKKARKRERERKDEKKKSRKEKRLKTCENDLGRMDPLDPDKNDNNNNNKSSKDIVFSTKVMTNHRIRAAKFQIKTNQDYKSIFGYELSMQKSPSESDGTTLVDRRSNHQEKRLSSKTTKKKSKTREKSRVISSVV
jgi:hypothetical protein